MKKFNVTGTCLASEDYMVDISGKVRQIAEMIEKMQYFTINKARQFGKTTTIIHLEQALQERYLVSSIRFEGVEAERFKSPESFCHLFLELIQNSLTFGNSDGDYREAWLDETVQTFEQSSRHIATMCKGRKVVLIIDEVDKISSNPIF